MELTILVIKSLLCAKHSTLLCVHFCIGIQPKRDTAILVWLAGEQENQR